MGLWREGAFSVSVSGSGACSVHDAQFTNAVRSARGGRSCSSVHPGLGGFRAVSSGGLTRAAAGPAVLTRALGAFSSGPTCLLPGAGHWARYPGTAPCPGSGAVGDQGRDPCHAPVTGCPWWAPKTKDGDRGSTESENGCWLRVGGPRVGSVAWRAVEGGGTSVAGPRVLPGILSLLASLTRAGGLA